jgi:hypothetical protein
MREISDVGATMRPPQPPTPAPASTPAAAPGPASTPTAAVLVSTGSRLCVSGADQNDRARLRWVRYGASEQPGASRA